MTLALRIARNHGLLLELALRDGELWQITERRARLVAYVDGWYQEREAPITGAWS